GVQRKRRRGLQGPVPRHRPDRPVPGRRPVMSQQSTVIGLSAVHEKHLATLRAMPAVLGAEGLRIGAQYVMFFAEAGLMRRHVAHLVQGVARPDVLEVGLGLGVFAMQLISVGVNSYTAVEPLEQVARLARHRVLWEYGARATVL